MRSGHKPETMLAKEI